MSFSEKMLNKIREYSEKTGKKEKNFKNGHNKKTPTYAAT